MKKIKTFNKLLNSAILLSPITSIAFNNQHQVNLVAETKIMGDITVSVTGATITSYISGSGTLEVSPDITTIGINSFARTNISALDLSQASSLATIESGAFVSCIQLTGDITFPSTLTTIGENAFAQDTSLDNLIFKSETPPTSFGQNWQPVLNGKVYVPSESAKSKYASVANFNFSKDQIEIGEPSDSKKIDITKLLIGILVWVPVFIALMFVIWFFFIRKKQKPTEKK